MPISEEEFNSGESGWFSEVEIALFLVDHEGQAFTARELFKPLGHSDLLRLPVRNDAFSQFGLLWTFHQALHHVVWDLMLHFPPEGRSPKLDRLHAAVQKGFKITRRRLGSQLYYCAKQPPPGPPLL